MSLEIPQKKTYGSSSEEATRLLHHSLKNVKIWIDINQMLSHPLKGLMGKWLYLPAQFGVFAARRNVIIDSMKTFGPTSLWAHSGELKVKKAGLNSM